MYCLFEILLISVISVFDAPKFKEISLYLIGAAVHPHGALQTELPRSTPMQPYLSGSSAATINFSNFFVSVESVEV